MKTNDRRNTPGVQRIPPTRERGAATLLLSVVLLLVLTLLAGYTSRSSLTDLAIVNNQLRLKQAQSAADAAMDFALAYYITGGADQSPSPTPDGVADTLSVPTTLTGGNNSNVAFCDAATMDCNTCNSPTDLSSLGLRSIGFSDDQTSTYCATVVLAANPVLSGGAPKAALTAKGAGTAKLNGNLTVINNNPGGITIWTGTDIGAMTGSFETKISIDGNNNQTSSGKDGSKFFVGPDVVYNDQELNNMSYDDFVVEMTGRTPDELATLANIKISGTDSLPAATAANDYLGNQLIYVDKATFDPNTNLGTPDKPVILVVNGNFEINGPNVINGIVIAKNLAKANGTARINGAMIMENVTNSNGGFTIEMVTSTVSNAVDNITVRAPILGSWRDWMNTN